MDENIQKLLNGCFVVIDKPRGPPSAQVSNWVRDILCVSRSGHIGTLDPKVSGVLIIALGKAVRLSRFLSGQDKEYIAVMHLHKDVHIGLIEDVLNRFVGEIVQKPPVKSAVAKRPRKRKVYSINILEKKGRDVLIHVFCEGGVYVRTLIHSIGKEIGCGANMTELRRIRSGSVGEGQAHTLYELKDAVWLCENKGDCTRLSDMLIPPDALLNLPSITVKDTVLPSIAYGSPIYRKGILKYPDNVKRDDFVKVYSENGVFCGVAQVSDGPEMYAKMRINWLNAKEFGKKWKPLKPL
ncbi:MAG: RNA-guided pseudouridylation complex pseudouridine synthase subunit Cbf5 [Candidatus Micrarchaeia archaeon]